MSERKSTARVVADQTVRSADGLSLLALLTCNVRVQRFLSYVDFLLD